MCKRGEETLAKALFSSKVKTISITFIALKFNQNIAFFKLNKALAYEAEVDDLDTEISDDFKRNAE